MTSPIPQPAPLHPYDTSPPGLITLEWLRDVGADLKCHSYEAVAKEWGESHQMTLGTLKRAAELNCDLEWLARKLLFSSKAWDRYEAEIAESWARYKAETAEPSVRYEAEIAVALWHAWQMEIGATHVETSPRGES